MTTAFRPGGRWHESSPAVTMDSDEFDVHFRDHVAPHFAALEKLRLTLKNQYTWRLAIAGAGTFCLFLVTVIARSLLREPDGSPVVDAQALLFVPLFAGILLMVWAQGPRRRFVREYKETLLPAIAGFFGKFAYESGGGIGMDRLQESTLIPSHDRYHHEDLFTGSYRDVGVEFCEARLTERRGTGKNRRTVTVFAGIFVLMIMNKDFKGKTVVRRDAGKLGNFLRENFSGKLEPVKLEDPRFEKQFEVYSSDQVEARYLLTPAFMTRLLDLCGVMGTDNVEAAFMGKQLMIKLPVGRRRIMSNAVTIGGIPMRLGNSGGGLFEPGSIYTTVHNVQDMNRIIDEFRSILSIVDTLKLYERTGL